MSAERAPASSRTSGLSVRGLVKRYPGADAPTLRGVTLDVPGGALAAVLGLSGAGKSTLLRCLAGLEAFDAGTLAAGDATVYGEDRVGRGRGRPAALAALRGRVGLVFQSFELFPHLSVMENCVLAPTRVRGVPRPVAEARAAALLEELGLGDKARAFPDHLSGGQRQRVAIARALCMEPRALLYDEPTSALDPSLKAEVAQALARVKATGVTQLVVTHDVQLARDVADVVFILDRGEIAESGPPSKVLLAPEHEATRRLVTSSTSLRPLTEEPSINR